MTKAGIKPICALLGLLLAGCRQDRWAGFVYPDRGNLTVHREIGEFTTLETCRIAARKYLSDLGAIDTGDYECGKNCRSRRDLPGIKVCKETLR